jgi:hypothetical protein
MAKYQVCIVAIFRNEHQYISEWIDYHLKAGVDHLYLYDNGNDHWELIEPYSRFVTYHAWTDEIALEFTKDRVKLSRQTGAYTHCIEQYKDEVEWLQLIDLDEFLVPLNSGSIKDEVPTGSKETVWRVPRINFGNSGSRERKVLGSIEYYYRRERRPSHHKDLGRVSRVKKIKGPHTYISEGEIKEAKGLVVHHHYTRSLPEWITRAKIGGGQKDQGFRVFIGKRLWLAYLTYFMLNLRSLSVLTAAFTTNVTMHFLKVNIWVFIAINIPLTGLFIWSYTRGQNEVLDTRLKDLYNEFSTSSNFPHSEQA